MGSRVGERDSGTSLELPPPPTRQPPLPIPNPGQAKEWVGV
jgi:hypothetical protein